MSSAGNNQIREGEQGFLLVGVVVLVFLVLLALSVAAPKVAKELRREREVEAIHRGNEYVRALQLYYRKFGRYPGTMDQLEKSTNIRFLRQKYTDPLTGKADWRLIHIGEAKTTVKGFFGKPLAGLPSGAGGLGAASSMVSGQQGATVGGASGSTGLGSTSGSGLSGSQSSSGFSLGSGLSSGSNSGSTTSPGGTVSSPSSSSSSSSGGIGSQSATSFSGGGAPIVGIGCSHSGSSIAVLNEQTTYQTWEFIYDPRIEQLKAKAALLGGGSSSGFGSGSGFGSSPGSSSSPSSGFGSSSPSGPSSGFGSGSSGFGSGSSGGSTPTPPSTNPQ